MRVNLLHYLAPDLRSVLFAFKGLAAVALALAVSMSLDLDKPFWAMVAAMMLQARPEAGLVIEKAACLVLASMVGAAIAGLILDNLAGDPALALGALALCVAFTSAIAASLRHVNFVFAVSLVSVTAILIVLFAMADPSDTSSLSIFLVVRARIGEVLVGASCAIVASVLLYPFKLENLLKANTHRLVELSLTYLATLLQPQRDRTLLHTQGINIIALTAVINDDTNAAAYERAGGVERALAVAHSAIGIVAWGQHVERILNDCPTELDGVATIIARYAETCRSLKSQAPALKRLVLDECRPNDEVRETLRKNACACAMITSLDNIADVLSAMLGNCNETAEAAPTTKRVLRFKRHWDWLVGLKAALRLRPHYRLTVLVFA